MFVKVFSKFYIFILVYYNTLLYSVFKKLKIQMFYVQNVKKYIYGLIYDFMVFFALFPFITLVSLIYYYSIFNALKLFLYLF